MSSPVSFVFTVFCQFFEAEASIMKNSAVIDIFQNRMFKSKIYEIESVLNGTEMSVTCLESGTCR